MKIKKVRGVKDILPGEIEKWQWVESITHSVFANFGFKEIRIPIFEYTNLFSRGIGETTDIVEKEMYTFEDKGGEMITLRPEGTASVARAYVENKLYNPPSLTKLYYIGPMFRYERPQAGRFRQFYQIGVEAMGSQSPSVDAEVICMVYELLKRLGLKNTELQINSLGCPECRPQYRELLKKSGREKFDELCNNCQQRLDRNPLRLLDCKVETCSEIAQGLPKTAEHLCEKCDQEFNLVKELLKSTNTDFNVNFKLVRGLDYYSKTAFEIVSSDLGAQSAVCGGGRYDQLVEEFDGPATPCFGFAIGLDRLVSLISTDDNPEIFQKPDLFIVALGEAAEKETFKIAQKLRKQGVWVDRGYESTSMKSQMRKADKSGAAFVLILGENELSSGICPLKNMSNGEQKDISLETLLADAKSVLISTP
jgi:histidyl-tRNA synthetase